MEIPDSHKMEVVIVANKYKTNVPYSATLTKKFYDGSQSKQIISGMYEGVSIHEVKVEYGEITPLASLAEGLRRRKRREADLCGEEQKARFSEQFQKINGALIIRPIFLLCFTVLTE